MTAARPRQRNTQREWSLQRSIVVYLSKALPLTAYFTSIDIGSAGSAQAGQLRKARGVKPGIADIMVIWSGTVLFLEIKAGTQLSEAQKLFRDQVTANGCWWALARCPEDVEQACILAGIPLRATFGQIHARIAEQNARLPAKRKRSVFRKPKNGAVTVAQAHKMGVWRP